MIRRSALLATAIALGSCVLAAPKAFAEDLIVPFEANIEGACVLTLVSPGILARNIAYPQAMAAEQPGGQLAQIETDCNMPALISIADPVQTEGPQLNLVTTGAYLIGNVIGAGPGGTDIPAGLNIYDVDMFIESDVAIPSGDYRFEVTLTAAPN